MNISHIQSRFIGTHSTCCDWNLGKPCDCGGATAVPIPTTADMAHMMVNLGTQYLAEHAPERLKEHEAHCNLRFPATMNTEDDHCDCVVSDAQAHEILIAMQAHMAAYAKANDIDMRYTSIVEHEKLAGECLRFLRTKI